MLNASVVEIKCLRMFSLMQNASCFCCSFFSSSMDKSMLCGLRDFLHSHSLFIYFFLILNNSGVCLSFTSQKQHILSQLG